MLNEVLRVAVHGVMKILSLTLAFNSRNALLQLDHVHVIGKPDQNVKVQN